MATADTHRDDEPTATGDSIVPEPEKGSSIETIQADIERTRSELGTTVAHLTEKLDVKSRAKRRLRETSTEVTARVSEISEHTAATARRAKAAVADGLGRPNRNGWILAAIVAVALGAIVAAGIRRR